MPYDLEAWPIIVHLWFYFWFLVPFRLVTKRTQRDVNLPASTVITSQFCELTSALKAYQKLKGDMQIEYFRTLLQHLQHFLPS